MADEKDDEAELIPIVEGEEPEKVDPPAEGDEKVDPPAEGDEEGDEDERLGDDHEDDADADASANSNRRRKRRQQAREKRDAAQRELDMLRWQNAELAKRLGAVESNTLQGHEQALQARYQQMQRDLAQAEDIYAKAITAGEGEHAAHAMKIRDAIKSESEKVEGAYNQLRQQRERPAPDQRVVSHAQEWIRDNPWYDPQGADPVSKLTKQIDTSLAAEGFNPAHRAYWEELTSRVSTALSTGAKPPANGGGTPTPAARGAPPMGGNSEHAPTSTRKNEIRVTPERKAAMVEAGVWDDPVRRQRMLKEYARYDKEAAR